MAIHVIPELDKKGLREFGLVTGGIVAALFGLFFPWVLERPWPLWPWILFAALGGLALIAPLALRPIYWLWMRFGLLASRVTTPLILGIVFFFVIFPVGFARRLKGRDALRRWFDERAVSYRIPSVRSPTKSFERPF
jgi:hypothetical protein